ncbi:MAG: hypothetical protein WD200_03675 [Candidatus Andersenbacteria bacterium]
MNRWQDAAKRWSSTTLFQEAFDRAISELRDLLEGEEAQAIKALLETMRKQGSHNYILDVFENYSFRADGLWRFTPGPDTHGLASTDDLVSSLFESGSVQRYYDEPVSQDKRNRVRIQIERIISTVRSKLNHLAQMAPPWPAQE